MNQSTIRLHLSLIKLAKGLVRAWEELIKDYESSSGSPMELGMHPRNIRFHLALIKLAKGAVRAWEEWVQDFQGAER